MPLSLDFLLRIKTLGLRSARYTAGRLGSLLLYVFKHPLKSIWWCVKMYFTLMLLVLFLAFSFGSFANPLCPAGSQFDPIHGCYVTAPIKQAYRVTWEGVSGEPAESFSAAFASFGSKYALSTTTNGQDGFCTTTTTTSRTVSLNSIDAFTVYFTKETRTSVSYSTTTPGVTCPTFTPTLQSTPGHAYPTSAGTVPYCPPDGKPEFLNKVQIGGIWVCAIPKPTENNCFKSPNFALANQYHFDPSKMGYGTVCVTADNGDQCPWKEMAGSSGVFQPDTEATNPCLETPPPPPSSPLDPPKDPEKCMPGGNGMKICLADPNEKCVPNSTGALSCEDSCGYQNDVFMCFTPPDIPSTPNDPDPKPKPPVDDDIDSPDKPLMDMIKGDFKQIQRGVESRVDGLSVDIQNMAAQSKADGDKLAKAAGTGNKLLNSINQNTADTVKELKKLTDDESNPQPNYEEVELGTKNDWEQRNFGSIIAGHGESLLSKPMFVAVNNFFTASFTGSCPTWSVSVWAFDIEINQFCSATMNNIWPYIRAIVLLVFGLIAFREAFL